MASAADEPFAEDDLQTVTKAAAKTAAAKKSSRERRVAQPLDRRDAIRYRERQRVMIGLIALLIIAIAAGAIVGLGGWIATGVVAVGLIAYLGFLRKAVMKEQQVRAQRAARAARLRREEAQRREREAQRAQFVVRDPEPRRLRKPGGATVLEIDDEDAIFEHLPRPHRNLALYGEPEYRRVAI